MACKGQKMMYEPTSFNAIDAYIAAVHYHTPSLTVDPPPLVTVKQTSMCAFRILPIENPLKDVAICLYDRFAGQWLVLLQDGAIVRMSDKGDGFVIVPDDE